jgi:hypothetical protein
MKESIGLHMQEHHQRICQERGWNDPWPDDVKERALRARALFGLDVVFGTDGSFVDAREELGAGHLAAATGRTQAREILRGLSDPQKEAVLRLIDDVLDSSTYSFLIRLDRCEFGQILLKHQETDDENQPDPTTEVLINPGDSDLELFQEACLWKEDFSFGAAIGRREASG